MKKIVIGVIITALLLTGCSQGEPVELKMPYNVETAAEAAETKVENSKSQMKVAKTKPESRVYDVADAVIATPAPTPAPTPEPTPEPAIVADANIITAEPLPEPEPIPEPEIIPEYVEPAPEPVEVVEEMPIPADEFAYIDHSFLGTYTVTWYSREAVGYDAPGASGNGLVPYYSCAMPDYSLLNCTVLVEGYGFYHVDDISPAGIVDLYVASNADIPGYGMDSVNVYLVG